MKWPSVDESLLEIENSFEYYLGVLCRATSMFMFVVLFCVLGVELFICNNSVAVVRHTFAYVKWNFLCSLNETQLAYRVGFS
jgi:hypothetical protein